jgi:hypothetical protein
MINDHIIYTQFNFYDLKEHIASSTYASAEDSFTCLKIRICASSAVQYWLACTSSVKYAKMMFAMTPALITAALSDMDLFLSRSGSSGGNEVSCRNIKPTLCIYLVVEFKKEDSSGGLLIDNLPDTHLLRPHRPHRPPP